MLNKFTDQEAIEIAIEVRDNLELNGDLPLQERWREKDAIAHIVNRLEAYRERYGDL